jgi:hypothetical protein
MSQCAISIGQSISVRCSKTSQSLAITNKNVIIQAGKSQDRNLISGMYVEDIAHYKNFSFYGGAGIHAGVRYELNWKRDGNTIFLAGVTGIVGIRYNLKGFFIGADINPRTDIPIFGGCVEHKYCSEDYFGGVNLSIGVKLN